MPLPVSGAGGCATSGRGAGLLSVRWPEHHGARRADRDAETPWPHAGPDRPPARHDAARRREGPFQNRQRQAGPRPASLSRNGTSSIRPRCARPWWMESFSCFGSPPLVAARPVSGGVGTLPVRPQRLRSGGDGRRRVRQVVQLIGPLVLRGSEGVGAPEQGVAIMLAHLIGDGTYRFGTQSD